MNVRNFYVGDRQLELTGIERGVLAVLYQHPGETVFRDEIFSEVWPGPGGGVQDQSLRTVIKTLRRKLVDCGAPGDPIRNTRGQGYILTEGIVSTTPVADSAPAERPSLRWAGPPPRTPFVGRQRYLADLQSALYEAKARRGQIIAIVAPGGMGKTRLLEEFREHHPSDITCIQGRCFSYGNTTPYRPFIDLLRTYAGIAESDNSTDIVAKLTNRLTTLKYDASSLNFAAPYLLNILGIKAAAESLAEFDPETIKVHTAQALRQLILHIASGTTLVLVIEDVHWIDESSRQFLEGLLPDLSGTSVVLICTLRPDTPCDWLLRYRQTTTIHLLGLGEDHSTELASFILQDNDMTVVPLIVAGAAGNPFFIEESAWELHIHPESTSDFTPETTITDVLIWRIRRLSNNTRQVLAAAAVLGQTFPYELIYKVLESDTELDTHIRQLMRLGFLEEDQRSAQHLIAFRHAYTHQVAYDHVSTELRTKLHLKTGIAIEQIYRRRLEEVYDLLARHYSKTNNTEKAVRYLTWSLDHAARVHAHTEAVKAAAEASALINNLAASATRDK